MEVVVKGAFAIIVTMCGITFGLAAISLIGGSQAPVLDIGVILVVLVVIAIADQLTVTSRA